MQSNALLLQIYICHHERFTWTSSCWSARKWVPCYSLLPNSSIFLSFFNINAFGWIILCWICDNKVYFYYTLHAYSSCFEDHQLIYCKLTVKSQHLWIFVCIVFLGVELRIFMYFFVSLKVIHFAILSVAWGLNGQIVCNTWCLSLRIKQVHPISYIAYDDPRAVLCAVHVTVTQSAMCQSSF